MPVLGAIGQGRWDSGANEMQDILVPDCGLTGIPKAEVYPGTEGFYLWCMKDAAAGMNSSCA